MPISAKLPTAKVVRLLALTIAGVRYSVAEAMPGESRSVDTIEIPALDSDYMIYAPGNLKRTEALSFKVYPGTDSPMPEERSIGDLEIATDDSVQNASPTSSTLKLHGFIQSVAPDTIVADGNRVKVYTITFQPDQTDKGTPAEMP